MSDIRYIVAIAAGKGGVGKSSLTVNIALFLREMGLSVGVLDADFYGPSLARMLPPTTPIHSDGEKFIPGVSYGLRVFSRSYFSPQELLAVRAPVVNGFVRQCAKDVDWGELDYLLVDFPPGTGDIQLTLLQEIGFTAAVLVTTSQEIAAMDVEKAGAMFLKMGVPILGVVENMSYYCEEEGNTPIKIFPGNAGQRLSTQWTVPLLGQVPLDPKMALCCDEGKSLWEEFPKASAVSVLRQIACSISSLLTERCKEPLHWQQDGSMCKIRLQQNGIAVLSIPELQRHCPCIRCQAQGIRILEEDDVGVEQIDRVGTYALRIKFTSGCSDGMYPLELVKRLART